MDIKGIIFDLDGTLLDSMSCWEKVDRDFLTENGIEPPEGISDKVKRMTINQSAEYFKTRFGLRQSCADIINRIEEMVADRYINTIPPKKGAVETVGALHEKGFKMCVATATYKRLACAALERIGIMGMLDFVLTCSDVDAGKDSPEIFLRAAEKMGCEARETLVVEDSLHCVETASRAGFNTAAVYDEVSENEWEEIRSKALISINDLTELINLMQEEDRSCKR